MAHYAVSPKHRDTISTNDLEKTQKEVTNLNTRLNSIGVQPEVSKPGAFMALMKLLARPHSAVLGAAQEYTNPMAGATPGMTDPGAAFMRGLRGQEETWGKDVTTGMGASTNPWFNSSLFGLKIAPNTAGVLGTALDFLNPLDPLNWIAPGVGKASVRAVPKGMTLLEKAYGKSVAEELADKLGYDWVNDSLGKLSKKGNPTIETAGQLAGQLGNRSVNRGLKEGVNPQAVSDIILKAMGDRGLNATTRLVDKPKYHLTLGLQAPFSTKSLGKVKLPGSSLIATPAARGLERLGQTSLGQALGRSFATPGTFTPNTVPGSVWTRFIRSPADKPTMDKSVIIPDPNQLTVQSGKEAYEEIIKDLQSMSGGALAKEQDFERALGEALEGLSKEDRKDLMKALVYPDYQVKPHQVKAFEFLQKARQKMVDDYRALGVEFTPLENYVPFVTVGKPLTSDEMDLLKGVFGARVKKAQTTDLIGMVSKTADPHLIPRMVAALDPAEVNKVLGREWLTEDAGVAMARRGIKAIRGQEATTFLKGMFDKYGLHIEDLENLKNLPEGYVVVTPRVEGSGRVVLEAVKEGSDEALALPQEFALAYNEYTDLVYNPHKSNALMKFFDQSTRLYKTVAYMWTPGHVPRDFLSNLYNLWLGGMRNPAPILESVKVHMDVSKASKVGGISDEWAKLLQPENITMETPFVSTAKTLGTELEVPEIVRKAEEVIKNSGKVSITKLENSLGVSIGEAKELIKNLELRGVIGPADKMGRHPILGDYVKPEVPSSAPQGVEFMGSELNFPQWQGTSVELYETLKKMGLTESSGILTEFQKVGKDWSYMQGKNPFGKYTEIMRKATKMNDNVARIAGVIDHLQKGKTLEEAVGATKKVLFDYNQLTSFEKKFMKRVIPFYTWMRKNIPLQVEMMITKPGKYATTYKAMHDLGLPEDTEAPGFIRDRGGLKLEGKNEQQYIIPNMPFADLDTLPLSMDQVRELLGTVNPAIRAPIEMATNTALFSGQPLENYSGELTQIPLGHLLQSLGVPEEKIPLINRRYLSYLLNQIPPLRNVDVMSNPENARQISRTLSFLGGPQIYPEGWVKKSTAYEQRNKLRDLIRVLGDKGVEVPTMNELKSSGSSSRSSSRKGKTKVR